MLDWTLGSATQAVVLEALQHQKANAQAGQNAACQGSGGGVECPYDVQELLEKVGLVLVVLTIMYRQCPSHLSSTRTGQLLRSRALGKPGG